MPPDEARAALESAFDELSQEEEKEHDEEGGPKEDAEKPSGDTETGTDAGDVGDDDDDDVGEPGGSEEDKEGEPEPPKEEEEKDDLTPPVGWKAQARESWKELPKAAKEEILRRENEINKYHNETAEIRKVGESFQKVIRPFEPMIASQNSDPITAVKNLMTTAAGLTLGSAVQKAQIVSNIISQYGVDIDQLDQVLAGKDPKEIDPNSHIAQLIDQKLTPINQFLTQQRQQTEQLSQQTRTEAQTEVQNFASTHEFYEDVREDMADLFDLANKRGKSLTLEEAYNRAVALNTDVQAVVKARSAKELAAKKKKAASSLKPSDKVGDPNNSGATSTVRGALEAAFDQFS